MVEDKDAVAPFDIIQDQFLDFWVVFLFDGCIVDEISLGGLGETGYDLEGVFVEVVFVFTAANVADGELDVEVSEVALVPVGLLLDVVVGR